MNEPAKKMSVMDYLRQSGITFEEIRVLTHEERHEIVDAATREMWDAGIEITQWRRALR